MTNSNQGVQSLTEQNECAALDSQLTTSIAKLPDDAAWDALTRSAAFKIYIQGCNAVHLCESLGGNCGPEREAFSEAQQDLQESRPYANHCQSPLAQSIESTRQAMQAAGCPEPAMNLWTSKTVNFWRLPS